MTFEWNFPSLDCTIGPDAEGHRDIVEIVHWRYTASQGEFSASMVGTVGLDYDPTAPFIVFEDLTKTQVQGWVEGSIGEGELASMTATLTTQVSELQSPTQENLSPPWRSNGG